MATQQISTTGITGIEQLQFIREKTISWSAEDLRPNTRYFAFFDNKEVTGRVTQNPYQGIDVIVSSPAVGQIYTDSSGKASGTFKIPGMTFNVGSREFMLTDTLDYRVIPKGSMTSSAIATYTASGIKAVSQTTQTNITVSIQQNLVPEVINNVVNVTVPPPVINNITNVTNNITNVTNNTTPTIISPPPEPVIPDHFVLTRWQDSEPPVPVVVIEPVDPIAQSFFTYGIKGGFFLTKIELFFQTRDDLIPVQVSIREMIAGQPAANLVERHAVVSIPGSRVIPSADSLSPTAFVFDRPVYLQENKDYCFVVQTNSKKVHLWTSRMGEKMVDRDSMITDQPYIGSLFKSENNFTWTSEQYEDVKFRMYQAVFSTSPGTARFSVRAPETAIIGSRFTTSSGSNNITVTTPFEHCLTVNDRIKLNPLANCIFRGITSNNIKESTSGLGYNTVVSVADNYTFTFSTNAAATSSGTISTCNRLIRIEVLDSGNEQYLAGQQALIITPTGGDTITETAVAYANVSRMGKIIDVVVTNNGIGYQHAPTIAIASPGPGANAVFSAIIEPEFYITTNRAMDSISLGMGVITPPGASVNSTFKAVSGKTFEGSETPYAESTFSGLESSVQSQFRDRKWLLSDLNATSKSVDNVFEVVMSTSNENVSPVLSGYADAHADIGGYRLNSQTELVAIVPATAIVLGQGYTILSTGTTNFTTLGAPNSDVGTTFISSAAGTGGSGTGTVRLNSEVTNIGTAESRYFSRRVSLNYPANGFIVFMTALSEVNSNIDVYVKTGVSNVDPTSLNSIDHERAPWIPLICEVERNQSSTQDEFYEYEFTNEYDFSDFDVFELKIVMRGSNPSRPPILNDYRCIALAS